MKLGRLPIARYFSFINHLSIACLIAPKSLPLRIVIHWAIEKRRGNKVFV
jgi:hypothetical protein